MDSSSDVLAATVRAKRHAVDNDLEQLRVRTTQVQPRQVAARWGARVWPVAAGAAAVWLWRKRRRSVRSLKGLLAQTLSDLYRSEQALVPVLERMRKASSNEDLANLFARHRDETTAQIERLQRALRSIGVRPAQGDASAVEGIAKEARTMLKRQVDPDVRDASLIAAAQRAEHLEIANYGSARTFARTLGYTYAAELLQATLDEERSMDVQLTRLAERFVNLQSIR
jgi:ferritin-like metal-binding protein YciE